MVIACRIGDNPGSEKVTDPFRKKMMCGRYLLTTPFRKLRSLFDLPDDDGPELQPHFNIAPTQPIAVVRARADQANRELVLLRWGLVPSWTKPDKVAVGLINARAETVAEKPSFRDSFLRRRCLIPAS